MKKRILIALAIIALPLLSCTKEARVAPEEKPEALPAESSGSAETVIFAASTETSTKTVLSEDGDVYHVLWSAGDVINVNGTNMTLMSEDQPDGFGPGCDKGYFQGNKPSANYTSPKYKAIYPASLRDRYGNFVLPTEQSYLAGGVSGFPMYATNDEGSFSFKNLCGLICISLKGEKSISSISLVDKAGSPKPMSGNFTVTENAAVISGGSNGTALICGTPVELNTSTFTPFFITVPAGTYGALQILIEASDGSICTKTSKNPITVERSKIKPIELSNLVFKDETAQITYTTTNTTKPNIYAAGASTGTVFGDNLTVVSHNYDPDTKIGVITFSGPVTTIGYYAFRGIGNIQTVTIPNTVTTIGNRGFGECSNLETVNFPRSLTVVERDAFVNCYKFVPGDMSHITSIGEEAFQSVNMSGTFTIWEGLDYIGPKAFKYVKFSEVVFDHTPATMSTYIFESSSTLASVTFNDDIAIPEGLFSGCSNLSSVTFNANVTSIGKSAFNGCKFSSIDLPATVETIGMYAFSNCKSLTSLTLPAGLTTLVDHAITSCTSLQSVEFPTNAGFTTIPNYCFEGCTQLTSAPIPSNVTSIGGYAFKNCGFTAPPEGWGRAGITYGSYVFLGCPITALVFPDTMTSVPREFCRSFTGLQSVVLGSGMTSVGYGAFWGCTGLSSVTLNEGLQTIDEYAFENCRAIESIDIPSTVTTISGYAFENCQALTSVTLPASLTALNNNAFKYCYALQTVVFPTNAGFTTIKTGVFEDCHQLTTANIPSNITSIQVGAFKNCGFTAPPVGWDRDPSIYATSNSSSAFAGCPIETITFPDTWSYVPEGFCIGWDNLTEVHLGNGITTLNANVFRGCASLTDGSKIDVSNITNFGVRCFWQSKLTSLPAGINRSGLTLGNELFLGAAALVSADVSNWTNVPLYCFRDCSSLQSADLSSVVTMGGSVFSGDAALASVNIGSNVTTMNGDNFTGCTTIDITVRAVNPPSIGRVTNNASVFNPTIYVPAGSVEDYKAAANWSVWADRIVAIPEP